MDIDYNNIMNVNGTKNAVKGKRGFQKKEVMYEVANESTAIIQNIQETAKALGINFLDPVDAANAINRLLQIISIDTSEKVSKRASNVLETQEIQPAIAQKLYDNQVDRQIKLLDKVIPNKASVKIDVNAGRKVVIVRPD